MCNGCRKELPDDAFYKRANGKRYSPCIECVKKQRRGYYSRNREKVCERNDQYRKDNWERTLARAKDWKRRNRGRINLAEKVYRVAIKAEVFRHYSGGSTPRCKCCGEMRLVFLTLDHIDNNGAAQRRELKYRGAGVNFYRWLRNNGYPQPMQVLCWNCNAAKHYEGVCPHQGGEHVALVQ